MIASSKSMSLESHSGEGPSKSIYDVATPEGRAEDAATDSLTAATEVRKRAQNDSPIHETVREDKRQKPILEPVMNVLIDKMRARLHGLYEDMEAMQDNLSHSHCVLMNLVMQLENLKLISDQKHEADKDRIKDLVLTVEPVKNVLIDKMRAQLHVFRDVTEAMHDELSHSHPVLMNLVMKLETEKQLSDQKHEADEARIKDLVSQVSEGKAKSDEDLLNYEQFLNALFQKQDLMLKAEYERAVVEYKGSERCDSELGVLLTPLINVGFTLCVETIKSVLPEIDCLHPDIAAHYDPDAGAEYDRLLGAFKRGENILLATVHDDDAI